MEQYCANREQKLSDVMPSVPGICCMLNKTSIRQTLSIKSFSSDNEVLRCRVLLDASDIFCCREVALAVLALDGREYELLFVLLLPFTCS